MPTLLYSVSLAAFDSLLFVLCGNLIRNEAYKLCSIIFANLGAKIMKTSQCTK